MIIFIDFQCFFDRPFGNHFANFVRQRVPKGVPKETILKPLGSTGGNVKTMVLYTRNHVFEGLQGVPRELLCSTLRAMFFSMLLGTI